MSYDDELMRARWVRDFERHTPLSDRQARVVVGVRARDASFEELADELDVDPDVVEIDFKTAVKIAMRDRTTYLTFLTPRHEREHLDLYPGAARELRKYLDANGQPTVPSASE